MSSRKYENRNKTNELLSHIAVAFKEESLLVLVIITSQH